MRHRRTQQMSADAQTPLIQLKRVSRFYRSDRSALFDVSFDVYPREFIYVTGPSGAGKTTLLRLLHGAELPDTGAILFSGCNLADLKRPAISVLRRSMGVIFQDYRLIPDLSVLDNVGLPLEVAGLSRSSIVTKVNAMLKQVGLSGRAAEMAGALSGGEQQRVAIARAMIGDPEVILADEPTGSLDAYNADYVLDLLERASVRRAAVVLATHDKMLMAARPHRTIVLKNGRMVGLSPNDTAGTDKTVRSTKGTYNLKQTG